MILSLVDLLPSVETLRDVATLATLKRDAEVRRRYLRELLETQLDLECHPDERPVLSHTYLVCSDEVHHTLLSLLVCINPLLPLVVLTPLLSLC